MRKLLLIAILFLGFAAIPASAQYQDDYGQPRYDRGHHRGRYNRTYVRNEYRYVRYNGRVYKEIYRTTYYANGVIINRVLIGRERVHRYENYNDRDFRNSGVRFNVFLRF